jgi:transcriptional regulator with XRE-family HTH domain
MLGEHMDYKAFGLYMKNLRNELGARRVDISEHTGLSPETIRRVEEGIPEVRFTTLEILSHYYKVNLIKEISHYYDNDSIISSEKMVEVSNALTQLDFVRLNNCLLFNESNIVNSTQKDKQYVEMKKKLQAAICKLRAVDSLDTKVVIIQLEQVLFDCSLHSNTILGDPRLYEFELIVASTLVTFYRRCNQIEKSIDLCLLAISKLNKEQRNGYMKNRFLGAFYFNLCYSYHRIDENKKIIDTTTILLNDNNFIMTQSQLSGILYRRALAQHALDIKEYYDVLTTAILLSSQSVKEHMELVLRKRNIEHHLLRDE